MKLEKFLDGFLDFRDSYQDWLDYLFADRNSRYFCDQVEKILHSNFWKYLGTPAHWSDKYR